MRQSKITMKNGTTHIVRTDVDSAVKILMATAMNKWGAGRFILSETEQDIAIVPQEVSTIEDAGLWRAIGL